MHPCEASTGDIGMLDTVSGQFYSNDGTGAFSAGDEISEDTTSALDPYLWYEQDVPTESAMSAYLANVSALRGTLTLPADTPTVPGDMEGLTTTEANNIEAILDVTNTYLEALQKIFLRCGAAICGSNFYFAN